MNPISRSTRFALFLLLLGATAPLNAAAWFADSYGEGQDKAAQTAKPENSTGPSKTAVSPKKRASAPPACVKGATEEQMSGVAKKLKEFKKKNTPASDKTKPATPPS